MSFSYDRTLTIDHTKCGAADSTNFTVLVSLSGTYLKTAGNGGKVQQTVSVGGYTVPADLSFYSDSGLTTKLNWKVKFYDGTAGTLIALVKIPTVSHTVDTVFYLAYGDAAVTTWQGNVTGAWDGNYVAVYDLEDGTTLNLNDDTSSGFNLTNHGATATAGQNDGGANFVAASSQYLDTANPAVTGFPLTIEAWFKLADLSFASNEDRVIAAVTKKSGLDEFWVGVFNDTVYGALTIRVLIQAGGVPNYDEFAPTLDTNWHRIMAQWSAANTFLLYLDGVLQTKALTVGTGGTPGSLSNTSIGGLIYNTSNFYGGMNGKIADVRFSNSVRTADWDLMSWNNQSSPGTFISVGSEVPLGGSAPIARNIFLRQAVNRAATY